MRDFNDEDLRKLKNLSKITTVDVNKPISYPPYFMAIGGIDVTSFGNFSLLLGKPKSRKTFLAGLLCSVFINQTSTIEGIFSINKAHKIRAVVYIDTEQSIFHSQKVLDRIKKKSGLKNLKNFRFHNLRPYNTSVRLAFLEYVLQNVHPNTVVIVDGLRDFVSSINDEQEAINLSNILLEATHKRNIHVIGILHENKYNNAARGHLGTELVNKAELVFSVSKKGEFSTVKSEFSRGLDFEPFHFKIDDNELPIITKNIETKSSQQKKDPTDVDSDSHEKVIREVHNLLRQNPKRNELIKGLKSAIKKHVEDVGNNLTGDYLNYYLDSGLIKKVGADRSPKSYYTVSDSAIYKM